MTRQAQVIDDPLVKKIRSILRAIEPRPTPTEIGISRFGFKRVKCPDCGEWVSAKKGSYNHHWTLRHGTPFWREKQIADLIREGVDEK